MDGFLSIINDESVTLVSIALDHFVFVGNPAMFRANSFAIFTFDFIITT